MTSSVLILIACIVTTLIPAVPEDPNESPQYLCLIPLVLLGIGYSVYAAALWGCIPYTVPARLVGTAYGLCTAIQNIGMTISPILSALCLKTSKQGGYFWLMMYYSALAIIGIVLNVTLYFDDLRNRGGILDAVDNGENLEDLMSTPVPQEKRRLIKEAMATPDDNAEMEMNLDNSEYKAPPAA